MCRCGCHLTQKHYKEKMLVKKKHKVLFTLISNQMLTSCCHVVAVSKR